MSWVGSSMLPVCRPTCTPTAIHTVPVRARAAPQAKPSAIAWTT
ncbi:hypothetical protein [Nonomuraea insulae]|uniref:Uncharacterized protein n=1 Tax=Nonomuraea insulae TaxID=1616787 RepID=A0ABW1DCH5_9ACTN